MRKYVALLVGFISLLVLSACNFSLASDITPPPNYTPPAPVSSTNSPAVFPLVPPDPKQGAQLYTDNCMPCHGTTGLGDGPQSSNLPNPVAAIGTTDVARQSSPSQWFQIISNGNLTQFMPPFAGSLSDAQRWDVLAYVYTLSMPDKTIQDGKALYQTTCASCHGPTGKGDGEKAASLSTHPKDLTDQSQMASLSANDLYAKITDGLAPDMPAYNSKLGDVQRWALTNYIRSLFYTNGPATNVASAVTPAAPDTTSTPAAAASTGTAGAPTPAGTEEATAQVTTAPGVATTGTVTAGTITGKITFDPGAPTTTIPSGLIVSLVGYDGMNPVVNLTATVKQDGTYRLDNVAMPAGRVFMASITLNQTTFNSDVLQPASGSSILDLPIPVRATSPDTSVLSVDRMHVFLDFSTPGVVQVIELFIITNPTNKVVVAAAPGQPVLKFGLPTGSTNLQFQDGTIGQRYTSLPNGFGDTASIPPGAAQHQVLFAYNLPYQDKLELNLPAPLPVKAAVLMVPQGGVSVQSSQLTNTGPQNVQGTTFQVYTTNDIANGASLAFTLSGQPQGGPAGPAAGSSNTNLFIGGGIFLAALALSGWWLYRSGMIKRRTPRLSGVQTVMDENPDTLIDAIITLDELHKEGTLPDSAYQRRRAELKERLQRSYQSNGQAGQA